VFSERRPDRPVVKRRRDPTEAAKRNAFTISTRIVDIESLARRFAPFPHRGGGCARIKVRRAGAIVVVREWRVDGPSLTSGHEPFINSRRNWRFVYIKSGADTASRWPDATRQTDNDRKLVRDRAIVTFNET